MTQPVSNEERSTSLFRVVGYSLLVLALFDVIDILVPPQFMSPVWEFQAIGKLVERVPVPLLGLVLVLYGEANFRRSWEKLILKFLSRAALLAGILFLLLIPLSIANSLRLKDATDFQINTQVTQQKAQFQQVKQQLSTATAKDIGDVIARLNREGRPPASKNPQEVKSQLLSEIAQAETAIQTKADAERTNRQLALVKSVVKWNLGSLVSGIALIWIWRSTYWARRSAKRSR